MLTNLNFGDIVIVAIFMVKLMYEMCMDHGFKNNFWWVVQILYLMNVSYTVCLPFGNTILVKNVQSAYKQNSEFQKH